MLSIQKWLNENNNDLEKLKEDYGIKSRIYKDRVVLNYHQAESKKFDPISKECRSLILSCPNTDIVLSRSFDRFFNYGEDPETNNFDFKGATIFEKADGSLINLYKIDSDTDFAISTRSMAFAEGTTSFGLSFNELVLRTEPNLIKKINDNFCESFLIDHTFIFELCTMENQVIKRYDKDKLFLIAIRNKKDGLYLSDEYVNSFSYIAKLDRPEELYLDSVESLLQIIKTLPPTDEGYVCNNSGWRIKLKNPSYVALAHIKQDGLTPKRIASLIFNNESIEYLSYFKEDQRFFDPYIEAYNALKLGIKYGITISGSISNQKDFALKIKNMPCKNILFMMRNGHTVEDCFERMTDEKKLNILEKYKV